MKKGAISMKCQICNERDAAIIVAMNNGKEEQSVYVCHQCIHNMGLDLRKSISQHIIEQIFNASKAETVACKNCGKTIDEFKKTLRYGCSKCHLYFDEQKDKEHSENMNSINRALQQDKENRAKLEAYFSVSNVKNASQLKMILITKKMLSNAIENENYEEAAKLRDKLRKLEK